MFKKIAMILTLAFSLASLAAAQAPLPGPPGGGGNIVLK